MTLLEMRSAIPGVLQRVAVPGLAAIAAAAGLSGCAGELDDESEYIRPGLAINTLPRRPNAPPMTTPPDTTPPDTTPPDTTPPDTTPPPSTLREECRDVPERVLAGASCVGLACHGSVGTPPVINTDLASDPANAATLLRDKPAPDNSSCVGEFIINSNDPDSSLLITKIFGATCGGAMPAAGFPELTEDEKSCLADWVRAVAAGSL